MAKFYKISKNQFILDGKSKSCIYDLENKKLYHINHNLSNLLKRASKANKNLSKEEKLTLKDLDKKGIHLESDIKQVEEIDESYNSVHIEFAWIEVCTRCNLKCIHCYNESDAMCTNEMSFDDFVLLIDSLVELGVKKIQFIGGEPLIIGDKLKDMIKYAYKKFDWIEVFTNGTLIDEKWVEVFSEYGVRVALSVYSYLEQAHEKVTQLKGSYNRTNRAIQALKNSGIQYRVCNTIMDKVDIGEKNNDLYTLSKRKDIVRMSGRGNLHLLNDELIKQKLITKETFSGPLNKTMIKRGISHHNCFGSKIYVSSDLTVYPCVMERRFSHGNIHENNSINLKTNILNMNKDQIKGCSECEFRYCCFDCRPDAFSNDIYSKPWYCTYDPEKGKWIKLEEVIEKIKAMK